MNNPVQDYDGGAFCRFLEKIKTIVNLTKTHSINLAQFVAIYKTIMVLLRRSMSGERTWHALFAGGIGGYLIFSQDNNVNNQIVLYLLARVSVSLVSLALRNVQIAKVMRDNSFVGQATIVWALVMWLFRHYSDTLHSSLRSSMEYLYNDSDMWSGLWTLLIHNK